MTDAYLTVEAALVFPVVLAVQLLTVYLFVFQYDRCLLNQDMARLVVLGCGSEEQEKSTLAEYLKKCAGELYLEKYASWETETVELELSGNYVRAEGRGRLALPVSGWRLLGDEPVWEASASYESKKTDPAVFIRQYRKLRGEK